MQPTNLEQRTRTTGIKKIRSVRAKFRVDWRFQLLTSLRNDLAAFEALNVIENVEANPKN